MSMRSRRVTPSRRSRLASLFQDEARQQLFVTIGFILTIVAVLLILFGALGLAWYNDNLRPLASVAGVDIGPPQLRAYVTLEGKLLQFDQDQLTQAQINGTVDATTYSTLSSQINTEVQNLASNALSQMVDLVYQSRLASDQGIAVTSQDIDQRLLEDVSSAEQRHVLAIFVAPQAADPTTGPTIEEQRAALDKAQAALDALNSGQTFASVAAEYSTDPSAAKGGDYGIVDKGLVTDANWGNALFKLPQGGTTGIILGADGVYRIGRVTQITPGTEVAGDRSDLFSVVAEQDVRQLLGYQIGAERLQDKIVSDALAQTPEQVHLGEIYIDGVDTGDPTESAGEIHYSEIVFAPNHDMANAPTLAADDPAWHTALQDADTALAQLKTTAAADLESTFSRLASELSDDPTKSQGGDVGWMNKDLAPATISDALWGSNHQKDDIIGPVRSNEGYYLLLFQEKRASLADRIKAVQDALAQPGADFATVSDQLDESTQRQAGGDLGWWYQDELLQQTGDSTFVDAIFALNVGQVSDPLQFGNGNYFIKLLERTPRAYDPDQAASVRASAFSTWYQSQLSTAENTGNVSIAGQTPIPTLIPGTDQVSPAPSP
jgi:parvulin-like peptidyl-prolyl isomerase